MKKAFRLLPLALGLFALIAMAMTPSEISRSLASPSPREISWTEFCKANAYDPHTTDEKTIIEYLDSWPGSTAEEEALTRIGMLI